MLLALVCATRQLFIHAIFTESERVPVLRGRVVRRCARIIARRSVRLGKVYASVNTPRHRPKIVRKPRPEDAASADGIHHSLLCVASSPRDAAAESTDAAHL